MNFRPEYAMIFLSYIFGGITLKKAKLNAILYIAMFLFAGFFIFIVCKQSQQSFRALPLPLNFVGEYSQDGSEWQALSEDTDLSAFDGDLSLWGRFDQELPEGVCICFYLDHIGMNVSVNGENVYDMSNEINSDMCGTGWQEWMLSAMEEDDLVEINLHNPHSYGNGDAYNELLDSLYMTGTPILKEYYEKEKLAKERFHVHERIWSDEKSWEDPDYPFDWMEGEFC